MFRTLLVVALAGVAGVAQDKKDPPKKVVSAEPTDVAKDADFAVQGEYAGEFGGEKVGVQVVARGEGKFAVKAFKGGLPGAGADTKDVAKGTAERKAGMASATAKIPFGDDSLNYLISDGKFTAEGGGLTLKKVERKSPTLGAEPPKGAVVLWGKEGDESKWNGGRLMTLSDGKFLTPAKVDGKGGDIKTKEKFGAFKMHVEFRLPWMPGHTGQGRGNSGVYLQDRYELQVLDSFGLTGENNECGGIYTQHKPGVNMCLPPMAWQTYDIEFTPAQFDDAGKKTKNGRATILHNGVKIHDAIEFPKDCPGGAKESPEPGPFRFQDHGDPVIYRNVWVLPVK
jgi:hypothetical protein